MEKSNGKEGIVGDIGRSIWENETRGRDRKGKREERGLLSPKCLNNLEKKVKM